MTEKEIEKLSNIIEGVKEMEENLKNQPTPTPQETITQLQARITQLEKDNTELRTAYDKSKNPQEPKPFNRKDIISIFGKEFE